MNMIFFCDILAVTQQLRDSLSFLGPKISLPCARDPTTVYCVIFNPMDTLVVYSQIYIECHVKKII